MTPTIISRRDAQVAGQKRFYTGEPCKRGHTAERFVANGNCVECAVFSTPAKHRGVRAGNAGWPPRAIIFSRVTFAPTPDEIAAAFLYAEAQGWLDRALYDVHHDRVLFDQYAPTPDTGKLAAMAAELDRYNRRVNNIRGGPSQPQERPDDLDSRGPGRALTAKL